MRVAGCGLRVAGCVCGVRGGLRVTHCALQYEWLFLLIWVEKERKKYKADFLKFLIYSHASCDETIVHLNFIKDTHENFGKEIMILLEKYDELGAKINKYIQYVEKEWR